MVSWIGHLSGFMKYVEFSYNQIESFTSRERLQPNRIIRNVSLKKNTIRYRKRALIPVKILKKFAKISFFQLSESATVLVIFCFLIERTMSL